MKTQLKLLGQDNKKYIKKHYLTFLKNTLIKFDNGITDRYHNTVSWLCKFIYYVLKFTFRHSHRSREDNWTNIYPMRHNPKFVQSFSTFPHSQKRKMLRWRNSDYRNILRRPIRMQSQYAEYLSSLKHVSQSLRRNSK